MVQEVNVTVKRDGTILIDASGFVGETCLEQLRAYQQYLERNGIHSEIIEQKRKENEMFASPAFSKEVLQ